MRRGRGGLTLLAGGKDTLRPWRFWGAGWGWGWGWEEGGDLLSSLSLSLFLSLGNEGEQKLTSQAEHHGASEDRNLATGI